MSIGVNLRVTGHTSIGGRKYQEDYFSVAYQQTENDQNLEYAYFGIYDGHGGAEASQYAKEHLMNTIVSQKLFWSENDDEVLKSIREGYIQTHYSMWREQDKWPKTSSGLPSTAGTTASIAFIRRGKIYIGHVGDSGIVLGYQNDRESAHDARWVATPLTEDHKPESYAEKMRITSCGGKVVTKSGVPRVVWNRPRIGHKGPVRRSTPIDEIPFLAVARSLGDLWSYNSAMDEFVVSPVPDVSVIEIDPKKYRCLIFGTDGLWNVMPPKNAVEIVRNAEMENVRIALEGGSEWKNPSKLLVNEALERWSRSNMKADNTSVVIIMLDPPGPPKRDVLKSVKNTIQHATIDQRNERSSTAENNMVDLFDCITRGEAMPTAPGVRKESQDVGSLRYHHHQHQQQQQQHHHHHHLHLHHHHLQPQQHHQANYHNPHDYCGTEESDQAHQHDQHPHHHHQQQQHHVEHEQQNQYSPAVPSTSYNPDLTYTDSFAESYNSLLDRSFENTDHSYTTLFSPTTGDASVDSEKDSTESYRSSATMVRHDDEDDTLFDYLPVSSDDETVATGNQLKHDSTYSLTNLQTKSERLRSEMMESCRPPFYHQHPRDTSTESGYDTGNITIIEHFHNYHTAAGYGEPRTSLPADDPMDTAEASGRSMVHNSYHHHQQQHPMDMGAQYHTTPHHNDSHFTALGIQHSAAYQMERIDYRHTVNNNGTVVVPCEPTCSKYLSKGKAHQCFATAENMHECSSAGDGNEENERGSSDDDVDDVGQQNVAHRIQINEITSSYVNSPCASNALDGHSDSECTGSGSNGSGDEENSASSTTSPSSVNQVVVPVLVKPRSKKVGTSSAARVITIFYETRSSRRRPRNQNPSSSKSLSDVGGSTRSVMKSSASFGRIAKRKTSSTAAIGRTSVVDKGTAVERSVSSLLERRILRSNGVINTAKRIMPSPSGKSMVAQATPPPHRQGLVVDGFGVTTTTPHRNLPFAKLRDGKSLADNGARGGATTTTTTTRRTRQDVDPHRLQTNGKTITRRTMVPVEQASKSCIQRTKHLRRAQ